LIYVLDVQSADADRDLAFFSSTVRALFEISPDAKVMVLVHKMDLVPEANGERVNVLSHREAAVRSLAHSAGLLDENIDVFGTSIWDETLYKAWSSVVHQLVPNVRLLEEGLESFAIQGGYDEAVLFERASFLVIASTTQKEHGDRHRFEKISNIVKQFKLIVGRGQGQFQGLRVGNKSFEVVLDACGGNTYLMVVTGLKEVKSGKDDGVVKNPTLVPSEGVVLNMMMARKAFEKLLAEV
jgi:Ras-related GTP-binding protein A/B